MTEKTMKRLWAASLIFCGLSGLFSVITSLAGITLPFGVKLLISLIGLAAVITLFVTTARLYQRGRSA